MAETARRKSNFELLRILALNLIISCHFASHGAWPDQGSNLTTDMALSFLMIWGEVGVNIFVLIAGYFMVNSRFKAESILKTVLETVFYSYAIQLLFVVLSIGESTTRFLIRSLLPISGGNYWFITAYVAVYVCSPMLIWFEQKLSNSAYEKVLLLLGLLLCVVPTVTTRDFVYSPFAWFAFVFMLGGYIRKYPECVNSRGARRLFCFCLGFILVSELAILMLSRAVPSISPVYAIYFARVNMMPEIGLSIGIFCMVRNWQIRYSKTINTLAKTALASYLITDNPYVREWLWPHFSFLYDMGWLAILCGGFVSALVLYLACFCIDSFRAVTLEKWLFSAIGKSARLTSAIETANEFMVFR